MRWESGLRKANVAYEALPSPPRGRLVHLPFSPAQACETHARSGEDHRPARDLVPDWAVVRYGKCDAPVKLRQQLCLEVVVEVVSLT